MFTVVVRTIVAPLFVQQIRSQREMQRMQPLVREVQRKHKGNTQKIAQETQALYREHGVNQFGGCLPLVIQMPILFALYQALIRASNVVTLTADQVKSGDFTALQTALPGITKITETTFRAPVDGPCNLAQFNGAYTHFLPLNCQLVQPLHFDLGQSISTVSAWLVNPFTGVHLDLAQPDHVFAWVIPGIGFGLSLLAVIAALLQFVQVKMTSPRPNPDDPTSGATSTMTYVFPLLTVFWGGLFASGLILYWIVYTAYLVGHQFLMMGWGNLFPIFGWTPPFVKRPPEGPAPRLPSRESGIDRASGDGAKPPPSTSGGQRPAVGQRSTPARPAARRVGTQRRRGRKR